MKLATYAVAFAACFFATCAFGQSFSCPMGNQPSCLDYGDKVCTQFSKCVAQDAQCFDSMTCYPGGFVCKSDMDELLQKAKRMASNYDDFRNCVTNSTSMEEVTDCVQADRLNP